jgi:hypothetical protein
MADRGEDGWGPPERYEVLTGADDRPRLRERWAALPRRARLVATLVTVAALGVATALYGWSLRPPSPPGPPHVPVPYPAQATAFTFERLRSGDPGGRDFTVELRATVRGPAPVTVHGVTQGYAGLRVALDEGTPVRITAQRPRTLVLRAHVTSCRGIPADAGWPFLDITLRNARARQVQSVIPGERYARALGRTLRTVCEPTAARFAPTA